MNDLAEVRIRSQEVRSLLDPEWRYTRARTLKSEGVTRFKASEDRWVSLFTRFLSEWSNATDESMSDLEDKFPDIFWAYQIYTAEDRGPRYYLEALVIAAMSYDEIADYLGLPSAVVDAYEKCFFDVRRHLDRKGALKVFIASRARSRGMRDLDPDPFWKKLALVEGEQFLFTLWNDGELESDDRKKFDNLIAAQSRRNALDALRVRDINSYNAHEIVEEYVALCKNEIDQQKVTAESEVSGGGQREFIAALMQAVKFSIAPINGDVDNAYMEMSYALAQGPGILKRLQGSTAVKEETDVPQQSE